MQNTEKHRQNQTGMKSSSLTTRCLSFLICTMGMTMICLGPPGDNRVKVLRTASGTQQVLCTCTDHSQHHGQGALRTATPTPFPSPQSPLPLSGGSHPGEINHPAVSSREEVQTDNRQLKPCGQVGDPQALSSRARVHVPPNQSFLHHMQHLRCICVPP